MALIIRYDPVKGCAGCPFYDGNYMYCSAVGKDIDETEEEWESRHDSNDFRVYGMELAPSWCPLRAENGSEIVVKGI